MWKVVHAGFWRLRVRCARASCQAWQRRVGHLMGQSSHRDALLSEILSVCAFYQRDARVLCALG